MVDFAGKQPTEKEYNIKAQVVVRRVGFMDSRGRQLNTGMVLLIPRVSDTECQRFLAAWEPEDIAPTLGQSRHFELSGFISMPTLHTATRLSINPPGPLFGEHAYLHVMSVGPLKKLSSRDGEWLNLKILPESEDETADEAVPE